MQIEEISYKRNDDGTYNVTMSQRRDDKLLTYGFPKVAITWSENNNLMLNTFGIYVPQVVEAQLRSSGNDSTLINFDIQGTIK